MCQTLRITSSIAVRTVARVSVRVPRRAFAVSALKNADTIQQMYLKELQAYKPPPVKAGDAEGSVQKFTPPSPPKAPEDTDLAKDMKAYEDQVVEIEGQATGGEQTEAEGDYFEDLKQFDEEPAHH